MANPVLHSLRNRGDKSPIAWRRIAIALQQSPGVDLRPYVHVGIGKMGCDNLINDATRVSIRLKHILRRRTKTAAQLVQPDGVWDSGVITEAPPQLVE